MALSWNEIKDRALVVGENTQPRAAIYKIILILKS